MAITQKMMKRRESNMDTNFADYKKKRDDAIQHMFEVLSDTYGLDSGDISPGDATLLDIIVDRFIRNNQPVTVDTTKQYEVKISYRVVKTFYVRAKCEEDAMSEAELRCSEGGESDYWESPEITEAKETEQHESEST